MKKLIALFFLLAGAAWGVGNTVIIRFSGAPSGTCAPIMMAINNSSGALYNCKAGAWNLVGGGGVGLADPGSNGIVARTGSGTTAARTITAGSAKISIGNGSGASANPSVDLGTVAESDITNLATDLSGKVPTTTTVNSHALSSNVTVSASDLTTGTLPHAQLPALVSGDIPSNAANTSGNAGTATALAADPSDCSSNNYATGIAASGNLTCSQVNYNQLTGTATSVFSGTVNLGFSGGKGQHDVNQAANSDADGTIALSTETSHSLTFTTAYASAPVCVLTPISDPTAIGTWWVTTSTSAVTANVAISGSITFNYHCAGNPN